MSKRFVFKPRTPDTLVAAPGDPRTEYLDAGHRGARGALALRVTMSGNKTWSFVYRFPAGRAGKPRRLTLGEFPSMTLAEARTKAEDAAKLLPDTDPSAKRDEIRTAAKQGLTWALLRTEWLKAHAPLIKASSLKKYTHLTEVLVRDLEEQGASLVPQTTLAIVRDVLRGHGTTTYSNHIRARFLALQRYAREMGWIDHLIVQDASSEIRKHNERKLRRKNKTQGPNGEPALKRPYTVVEMNHMLKVFAKQPARLRPYCDLWETMLYTGTRLTEAAPMRWDELDLDKGLWTIPAVRIKTEDDGVPLIVKLIPRVVTLLRRRRAQLDAWMSPTGKPASTASRRRTHPVAATYVFWSKTPAASVHLTSFRITEELSALLRFTLQSHNLRRTFATRYEEAGAFALAPTYQQLNHARPDSMTGGYSEYAFLAQKTEGMAKWAQWLDVNVPLPRAPLHIAR